MAIRLRKIEGRWVAICAACTVVKDDDVYIDDGQHEALADKFARHFNEMYEYDLPFDEAAARLVEVEESNNPAREWWDRTYGDGGRVVPAGHVAK
jgi:hypothetical protein